MLFAAFTVWESAVELLGPKSGSPEYVAVMVCEPPIRAEVVQVAVASSAVLLKVTFAAVQPVIGVLPSRYSTDPEIMSLVVTVGLTVAVKVSESFTFEGLLPLVRATAVLVAIVVTTVRLTGLEVAEA